MGKFLKFIFAALATGFAVKYAANMKFIASMAPWLKILSLVIVALLAFYLAFFVINAITEMLWSGSPESKGGK